MKLVIGRLLNTLMCEDLRKEYNLIRKKEYSNKIYVYKNGFLKERLLKTYKP